ncbi:MAG: hypothetical protein K0R75_3662 [Paenibacillaceae bacterium]|nr:hypothetical protein [Paenibacillaceae bacterium]
MILQLIGAVVKLFPSSYFREKRGIILEVGKLIIQVLQTFDKGADKGEAESEAISVNFTVNQTVAYIDIDFIEDLMDEWYRAAGNVDYPMVPFN